MSSSLTTALGLSSCFGSQPGGQNGSCLVFSGADSMGTRNLPSLVVSLLALTRQPCSFNDVRTDAIYSSSAAKQSQLPLINKDILIRTSSG